MNEFECKAFDNFIERHKASGTLYKIFYMGWLLIPAIESLVSGRAESIWAMIFCWAVIGLATLWTLGIVLDLALTIFWKTLNYRIKSDRKILSIFWRKGKGNLGFPRKAINKMFFKIAPKTGERYFGISLKKEMLQSTPESEKFFNRYRDKYGCDFALTDRQVGSQDKMKELSDYLRAKSNIRVENREKIEPLTKKPLNIYLALLALAMYGLMIYSIFNLQEFKV